MPIPVKTSTGGQITVDEGASQADMERAEPVFFRSKHGRRETYTVYRGCVIVRNTVNLDSGFGSRRKTRMTAAYVFGQWSDTGKYGTLCIAGVDMYTIPQAKKVIDRVLKQGWMSYGLRTPEEQHEIDFPPTPRGREFTGK